MLFDCTLSNAEHKKKLWNVLFKLCFCGPLTICVENITWDWEEFKTIPICTVDKCFSIPAYVQWSV
jgi:hypothetical protein